MVKWWTVGWFPGRMVDCWLVYLQDGGLLAAFMRLSVGTIQNKKKIDFIPKRETEKSLRNSQRK